MTAVRLKICGISRFSDVDAVNQSRPDFAGLVFAPSRRQLNEETALEFRRRLAPEIAAVGVFTSGQVEAVVRLARIGVIGLAQLHGDWSAAEIARLRKIERLRLIRAVSVRTEENLQLARKIADRRGADYLLLDGPSPGSGRSFDWRILKGNRFRIPFFLAGGINGTNLAAALAVRPFGIDLSSGAETGGLKDPNKITDITKRVRDAERRLL